MNSEKPTSFQDIIFSLQDYWSQQGCTILQPYDMQMGAGTYHPATVLRTLGKDPWKVAYVQPSRRPTDGYLEAQLQGDYVGLFHLLDKKSKLSLVAGAGFALYI